MKPGSSNISSLEREEDFAPTGVSCSMTCISDITECDTALQQEINAHIYRPNKQLAFLYSALASCVMSKNYYQGSNSIQELSRSIFKLFQIGKKRMHDSLV